MRIISTSARCCKQRQAPSWRGRFSRICALEWTSPNIYGGSGGREGPRGNRQQPGIEICGLTS